MSSRTRAASYSAPSSSSMKDHTERRGHRGKKAREIVCETCGKVYKHPVCLQKHRWEHNPLWRDTAQLLLSKHQQVQVMEAAAILVHGASLPTDRALWPSYTSGGRLAGPRLSGDGTVRENSPFPTVASSTRELPAPSSDDEEDEEEEEEDLEEVDEDDVVVVDGEQNLEEEEEDTDENEVSIPHVVLTPNQIMRGRSLSLAAPVSSHMPNLYGSYGVGTSHTWGMGGENLVNKSPIDAHASLVKSPRSPMAIPDIAQLRSPLTAHPHHPHPPHHGHGHGHGHGHHTSLSSFGSFTSSSSSFIPFGSAPTSSYIPSSSIRSGDWQQGGEEEDDMEMEREDDYYNDGGEYSRASSLYKRLAAATGNNPHSFVTPSKSVSRERRSQETMYEMEMD